MSTPYISELRTFSFGFAPKGWATCNGQILPINQNQALFSLLGTAYGGDGRSTCAQPNLQGRVPISFGAGFTIGQRGGEESHTLLGGEMPAHQHLVNGSTAAASTLSPSGDFLATTGDNPYAAEVSADVTLNNATITNTGGSQPHENRQPFLVLNVCIALQGIFPPRN